MGTSQQDATFLEGFADGGNAERQRVRVQPLGIRAVLRAIGQLLIGFFDSASWKHQGATGEVDGVMAHDHEDLQTGGSVAQQQDGGGRPGGRFHNVFLSRPTQS